MDTLKIPGPSISKYLYWWYGNENATSYSFLPNSDPIHSDITLSDIGQLQAKGMKSVREMLHDNLTLSMRQLSFYHNWF